VLRIVDIPEDVFRGKVAQSSVGDSVDDRAHLSSTASIANNDDRQRREEKWGGNIEQLHLLHKRGGCIFLQPPHHATIVRWFTGGKWRTTDYHTPK
jgi:hypothetical protein